MYSLKTNAPISNDNNLSGFQFGNRKQSSNQKTIASSQLGIQATLRVGSVDDPAEKEANRMADKIMQLQDHQHKPMPAVRSMRDGQEFVYQSCVAGGNSAAGISTLRRRRDASEVEQVQTKLNSSSENIQRQNENVEEEALQAKPLDSVQRASEEEEESVQTKSMTNAPSTVSAAFANQLSRTSGSGAALPKSLQTKMGSHMGADFSNVRIHTNSQATGMSQSIQAKAFTHGNNIYFNQNQYNPETKAGQHLLAHELTHTVQQGAVQRMVQREVINMPEETIRVGMPNTTPLTGDLEDTSGMTVSVDQARVDLNSIDATTPLPFTTSGWDSAAIMRNMGQYDRLPGTDSDAVRCVQAVGLMSHVATGIDATLGYLNAMAMQALLQGANQRNQTSLHVLEEVGFRIETRQANYGHLYWAMEAMHAIFNKDDRGTESADLHDAIVPGFDLGMTMQRMDVWCATPAEILAQGSSLANGEQFMLNTWTVTFNTRFEDIPGSETAERASFTYEGDRRARLHRIRRIHIAAGTKPAATEIDEHRDSKHGHQLLLMKDPADSHIKLYEPELTQAGNHLFDLTTDATALDGYFHDQPTFEMFEYVQILGKMTPSGLFSGTTP